jgi:predicted dehydrogenase
MIDKPIRVGFVGTGNNTRRHHLPKLQAQPGVELETVAIRSKESGERKPTKIIAPIPPMPYRETNP